MSNATWLAIAELEAVLWMTTRLSALVQTDMAGSLSYSFIHVLQTYAAYVCNDSWWVADVDSDRNDTAVQRWVGNAKFPTRTLWEPPVQSETRSVNEVFLREKKTSELGPVAQKLIGRLGDEFHHYLVPGEEDQYLALAVNPLTATHGKYRSCCLMYTTVARSICSNFQLSHPNIRLE